MTEKDKNIDEIIQILVRPPEFTRNISKKLICSRIPYFEKMFNSDCVEAKENKVVMNFEQRVVDSILKWVQEGSFIIRMEYVIRLYDAANYLMIDDKSLEPLFSHFREKFSPKNLPVILSQVSKVSKLINSDTLNSFICRHFLMIANTNAFLNYPFETVKAILMLELMVYSEYQVFEAILKWVDMDYVSRNGFLEQLFMCVRWSTLALKGVEAIYICRDFFSRDHISVQKYIHSFLNPMLPYLVDLSEANPAKINVSSEGKFEFHRSKQNFFISIHRINDSTLWINTYDDELCGSPIGNFTFDDTMSLDFFHGDDIADILFDSGTKGVRVDFKKQTFKWLKFTSDDYCDHYYGQIGKFFGNFPCLRFSEDIDSYSFSCYLDIKNGHLPDKIEPYEYLLLEYNGKFILIGLTCGKFFGHFPVKYLNYFIAFKDNNKRTFQATVLDNVVYILTYNKFIHIFDIKSRSYRYFNFHGINYSNLNEVAFVSHKKYDNKLVIVDKKSGKLCVYLTEEKKWKNESQLNNLNSNQTRSENALDLIGFTSTFLPMNR